MTTAIGGGFLSFNKIVYDIVDSYEISGTISGIVSGLISGMVSNPISEVAYGYASGYANGLISGVVQNDVIRNISSMISRKAYGSVSGIGYGMASTIAYAPGVGNVTVDKIVLNSFLDDSFSDFTNLYELSSSEGSSSLDGLNNAINPGGRGQLSKYFIINPDLESSGSYDVGSWSDNTNSKFRNEFLNFEASSGYITEPPYNDYFGGMGGNVIQNSFDFYEKNIPENGFVKIMYVNPSIDPYNNSLFRNLEITTSGGISILQDYGVISGDTIINKMVAGRETEVYYRISDRTKELDLEKSILNCFALSGDPNAGDPGDPHYSGYIVKYEDPAYPFPNPPINTESRHIYQTYAGLTYDKLNWEIKEKYKNNKIYITELDNHRRKLSFETPFRSNISDNNLLRNIKLDLKTTDRKFYFAIARDNQIGTVTINDILFNPEDQDEDCVYRKYKKRDKDGNVILDKNGNPTYIDHEFYAGESYKIEVKFKDEAGSLMKELISYYLDDCLEEYSISKSNNYIQTIDPFKMPARNVLLFLKTESTYMLNIFIGGNKYLTHIIHKTETTFNDDRNIPIIIKHFRDDEIIIEIYFSDPFCEIDWEDLKNQLSDVGDTRKNEGERQYVPYKGYIRKDGSIIPQVIKFLMPARDVTLYLKQKDYRNNVKILLEGNTSHIEKIELEGAADNPYIYKEDDSGDLRIATNMVDFNEKRWLRILYMAGDKIEITVYFISENGSYFYYIDEDFMKAQLASIMIDPIGVEENGRGRLYKSDNKFEGFVNPDQLMDFIMPNNDIELIIKEKSLQRLLTIKPEPYQYEHEKERRILGISYKGEDHLFSTLPLCEIPATDGEKVGIFIKFIDIYMHLDKDHLTNQFPHLIISEAGVNAPSEYYQYVCFTMQDENQTILLKWEERLFTIDFIYREKLISSSTLYDSNRVYLPDNDGKHSILNQFRLPHNTYPTVIDTGTIRQNKVELSLTPIELFKIDTNKLKSFYILNSNKKHQYISTESTGMVRYSNNLITVDMPKDDIRIFLGIFMDWASLKNGYEKDSPGEDSIYIDEGTYTITIAGACGGNGGSTSPKANKVFYGDKGSLGFGITFEIKLEESMNLKFGLGARGGNGGNGTGNDRFNCAGGGGGGGGTSFLIFDKEVRIGNYGMVRSIWCFGGAGGTGGDNANKQGGKGGSGGGYNNTGNGEMGGSSRETQSGAPGQYGIGFPKSILVGKSIVNNTVFHSIGSGNGYIRIKPK